MDLSRILSKKLTIFINCKPQTNGTIPLRINAANHTYDASLLDCTEHSVRKLYILMISFANIFIAFRKFTSGKL